LGCFLACFAVSAGAQPVAGSQLRVLVYGYLSDGGEVSLCLGALLRQEFETVEVDFQRPPAEMLYDSYYRTKTRDAVKTALNAKACEYAVLAGEQRRLRPLTHPLVKDACADFEVLSHLRDRLAHAHEAERLGFEVGRRIVFGSRISVSLIPLFQWSKILAHRTRWLGKTQTGLPVIAPPEAGGNALATSAQARVCRG
jgi:hypothetical protein